MLKNNESSDDDQDFVSTASRKKISMKSGTAKTKPLEDISPSNESSNGDLGIEGDSTQESLNIEPTSAPVSSQESDLGKNKRKRKRVIVDSENSSDEEYNLKESTDEDEHFIPSDKEDEKPQPKKKASAKKPAAKAKATKSTKKEPPVEKAKTIKKPQTKKTKEIPEKESKIEIKSRPKSIKGGLGGVTFPSTVNRQPVRRVGLSRKEKLKPLHDYLT